MYDKNANGTFNKGPLSKLVELTERKKITPMELMTRHISINKFDKQQKDLGSSTIVGLSTQATTIKPQSCENLMEFKPLLNVSPLKKPTTAEDPVLNFKPLSSQQSFQALKQAALTQQNPNDIISQ